MISQNKNDLHSFVLDNNKQWNSIIPMQDKNTIKCELVHEERNQGMSL